MENLVAEIIRIMEQRLDEDCFTVFGLRGHHEPAKVGDKLENSYQWDDGDWTDEELDGTCSIGIANPKKEDVEKALSLVKCYSGHLVLICGDSCRGGNDLGESIIRNAEVVMVI